MKFSCFFQVINEMQITVEGAVLNATKKLEYAMVNNLFPPPSSNSLPVCSSQLILTRASLEGNKYSVPRLSPAKFCPTLNQQRSTGLDIRLGRLIHKCLTTFEVIGFKHSLGLAFRI